MELDNIYNIACNGSVADLKSLLNAYGDQEDALDMMLAGIDDAVLQSTKGKKGRLSWIMRGSRVFLR